MKKFIFFSIVGAIALAMTSCGNGNGAAAGSSETPIAGTDYVVITTANGEKGLLKNGKELLAPSKIYKDFAVEHEMIVATTEMELGDLAIVKIELLTPEGQSTIVGDKVTYTDEKGGYFIAEGDTKSIYLPSTGVSFGALTAVALDENNVLTQVSGKIGVFTTKKETLVEPTEDYKKICLYKGSKKVLVQTSEGWGFGTINADKGIDLGNSATAADLSKAKAMTGWDASSPVMILE